MAFLGRGRKEDMIVLATELGISVVPTMTAQRIKELITKDEQYDEEFSKNLFTTVVEDRKRRDEIEEKRRQDE